LLLRLNEQDPTRGYDREAWAVLEARKGRIAAEALSAARPRLRGEAGREVLSRRGQALALDKALQQELTKAPGEQRSDRVENLTTLLAQTKEEYLRQVKAFLQEYSRYKGQFVDQQTVDPRSLAKFAERLPADTLAVQYYAAPDKLYLFVVAAGGNLQVKTRAVTQDDLYALVRAYRAHLEPGATWTDDGSAAYAHEVLPLKQATEALAEHLLGPIESELAAYSRLVVIPNDLLFYLPIHALTRGQPDGSVRFLAETHAVSYLTQLELSELVVPGASAPDAPLLAVGNPDGSLPGAGREIRELGTVRRSVTALEGSQATKARFLSLVREFPDLHLATHGILDPDRPEDSYLLMAGEDPASQRLTIGEIEVLSLAPGVAILSACETALGEQVPGAALITLAAAFSQAGARSIVASLWKVDDDATRDFMLEFHRAVGRGGPATALQKAQHTLIASPGSAHPYYWAPFILVGAR
jgi:CHAT domain-containing protein